MSIAPIAFEPPLDEEPLQPAADRVIDGTPRQMLANVYSEPAGRFHAGRWRSTTGAWRVRYTEHEFCHILQGRVRLSWIGGSREFACGDSFIVPAGFVGEWHVLEPTTKLYAIYEPAAG
jgi:uncharacterized cupin superfamily protein